MQLLAVRNHELGNSLPGVGKHCDDDILIVVDN